MDKLHINIENSWRTSFCVSNFSYLKPLTLLQVCHFSGSSGTPLSASQKLTTSTGKLTHIQEPPFGSGK